MIKCEVVEDFTLERFKELNNIKRKNKNVNGKLFIGDTFECNKAMADYLTGNNPLNKVVVKVIEFEPKKVIEEFKEETFKKDALEFLEATKPKKKKVKEEK